MCNWNLHNQYTLSDNYSDLEKEEEEDTEEKEGDTCNK